VKVSGLCIMYMQPFIIFLSYVYIVCVVPDRRAIVVGTNASFHCISGNTTTHVLWFLNGVQLGTIYFSNVFDDRSGTLSFFNTPSKHNNTEIGCEVLLPFRETSAKNATLQVFYSKFNCNNNYHQLKHLFTFSVTKLLFRQTVVSSIL
jgi:hypothetical protein